MTTIGGKLMEGQHPFAGTRRRRIAVFATAALAVVATAALISSALARTFTLQIAKGAKVTNTTGTTKLENIVVNSRGFAVYTLTGDSKSHPECVMSNGCLAVWPAVTVSSAKKLSRASGIHGKLGTWHRNGFTQVTLNGHPLYTFSVDISQHSRHHALGEGIVHFGGTWHVIKTSSSSSSTMTSPTTSTNTTPNPGY
jgi:predicted lipoprotein with Yx(FWY)xxD motif